MAAPVKRPSFYCGRVPFAGIGRIKASEEAFWRGRRSVVQTYRDGQIVDWIGRLGAAGAEHAMRRFCLSRTVAYGRLSSLVRDGLLEHQAILYARPGVYLATTAGLRWQGNQRLGRCTLSAGGFEHAWQIARVAVELEVRLPDWLVLSEREIRAEELDAGKLVASAQVGVAADRPVLHRPDLALVGTDGRVVAIEIELSVKSATRLVAICRGWARARHLDHVYYLAALPPARAVERAIRTTSAADRITVVGLDDAAAVIEGLSSQAPLENAR